MAIKLAQNEIFDMITMHLENCDIFIRKEAVYTVSNILTTLDPKDTLSLLQINERLLKVFLDCLQLITDEKIIFEVLSVIEFFGKQDRDWGLKGKESFMYQVEINGGYDHLEELQKAPNQRIYERVLEVMKEYVDLEEPSESEITGS